MLKKEVRTQDEEIIEKQKPYSYWERQGKNCRTVPIFIQGETREKQRNKSYTDKVKKKGRTEKHYLYSYRERLRMNRETKAILMQGKTREELKNTTHIHMGKDKGRTEKQKLYSQRERQGKN